MIYRFRAILDTKEDVFRDIEIEASSTMEDFHNAITQAFGFAGQEMASFYVSNEIWEQGEEIALFDMGEDGDSVRTMSETILEDTVWADQPRLLYVYDFLSMWTFMVELAEITDPEPGMPYPNLMFSHGEIPEQAPEKEFIAEKIDGEGNIDDDDDDFDLDADDYEDLDFDENWN
ncbi:IS1096 element passenger TnpR family protein [Rasiella sp. SM2506]|uniref:IS1096 element passenger TnpR family protein n=1 Tax=Rasiella sp. SM2506 TaxID=3423914 RepID=UPI003D7988C7